MIPIQEIKDWLQNTELPTQIKMNFGLIKEPKKFFNNHIATLERNTGNRTFLPYYKRLISTYKKISNDKTITATGFVLKEIL